MQKEYRSGTSHVMDQRDTGNEAAFAAESVTSFDIRPGHASATRATQVILGANPTPRGVREACGGQIEAAGYSRSEFSSLLLARPESQQSYG